MPLTNSTFGDIITLALKNAGVIGIGQTPSAEDMTDACALMNDMIAQWQQRRYLVYHLVEYSTPCNGGEFYTIGPGGDISVPQRPAAINAAFARQTINNVPNQIDYPLAIIPSRETYSMIAMKSLQSFPQWCWWDAASPLGKLYVYPVITSQFTLHVVFREQLQTAVTLADQITLPAEYRMAIMYNLSVLLAPFYGLAVSPDVRAQAQATLETMRTINAQVPSMSVPLAIRNGLGYNILGDNFGVVR